MPDPLKTDADRRLERSETAEIKGVWLRRTTEGNGGTITVTVELPDGTFKKIIEYERSEGDGPISHYVHPRGIENAPEDEVLGR